LLQGPSKPYFLGVPQHLTARRGVGRPVGQTTRGTTHPNRLRRVDRWMWHALRPVLMRPARSALVVDLGFGADSVTTVEMFERLRNRIPSVEVVGIEIDPERVRVATADEQPGLSFRPGGFEIPLDGRDATVVRAFNVLRQYNESEVQQAWDRVVSRLEPDGAFIEGTCDEIGRVATWVTLRSTATRASFPIQRRNVDSVSAVPQTLTFAADVASLERPAQFAERLPKALIHRNVAGEPIHSLLSQWDQCWDRAAPHAVFGPRQRWIAAIRLLNDESTVQVLDNERRWRLGELTVTWVSVAPLGG
jgi:hypothetical protein